EAGSDVCESSRRRPINDVAGEDLISEGRQPIAGRSGQPRTQLETKKIEVDAAFARPERKALDQAAVCGADVEDRSGRGHCVEQEGACLAPQLRIAVESGLPPWIVLGEIRVGERIGDGAMPLALRQRAAREGV